MAYSDKVWSRPGPPGNRFAPALPPPAKPHLMHRLYTWSKLGVKVRLRVEDPTWDYLAAGLHSCALESADTCPDGFPADLVWKRSGAENLIQLKGSTWGKFPSYEYLYLHSDKLIDDLILERLGEIALLHAATVVSPAGRSLVISGSSGSGKTSLATALILKGWSWLSDEYALIEPGMPLTVLGWPRNFNLKERSFVHFPETSSLPDSREFPLRDLRRRLRFFNPSSLRPGSFLHRTKPEILIFPSFDPGQSEPRLESLSANETIARLAMEFLTRGPSTFACLNALVADGRSLELRYADPLQGAALLESI